MKSLTPEIIAKYTEFIKKNPKLVKERSQQQYVAYIHIILTLIAVSFFGVFAIMPTLTTISNLKKQLADSEHVHESLQKKLSGLTILRDQYAQIQSSLGAIENAVPAQNNIPTLTRQLETLAYARNVNIDKIEIGQIELYPANKTNPPLYSFTFTLTLNGDPKSVQNFIYDIIAFDRIVHLEKVTTGTADVNSASSLVVGRAYFQTKR